MYQKIIFTIACILFSIHFPLNLYGESSKDLYKKYCASCHHELRYGISGPPLIPETLRRHDDDTLKKIIKEGLSATNMPPFKSLLNDREISGIVGFIKTPLKRPEWGVDDILKTRKVYSLSPMQAPIHKYDLTNIFMVVEGGTGSVAIMDGDKFKILDKIKVGAIHGGPKFDYSLHYAYMVSRDGWVVKYSLYQFKEMARMKVGINTRNIAVSDDNRILAVANNLPMNVILIDAKDMKPLNIINTNTKVGAIYNLKGKGQFIVNMRGMPEIWLIDYKNGFRIEKIGLREVFDDIFLEPEGRYVIGTSRRGKSMAVLDIKEKKLVARLPIEGMPHLASAALWPMGREVYAAIPHIKSPTLTIFKLYDWKVVKTIDTLGPGFFARTHRDSDFIWVDTNTDTIQVIEKGSFMVVKEITPEPDKRAMHIEFTKDGRYALVSIWDMEGAVVVYDNRYFKEIKRLPFKKPVGKYNATNKNRIF